MIERCNICVNTSCKRKLEGRLVTRNGRTTFTAVRIEDCTTREAFLSSEEDLSEMEDKHGLTRTRLLGC
jgi:hypothetical protein